MNKKIYYTYEYYIKETSEVFYVGKGKGERYRQISNRNKFFLDMYNSHECGVRIVSENLSESEAFENERELIKYYKDNTNYRLTNQTDGGDGSSGWKAPKEFKEKQSKLNKERWQDKEYRNKMIQIRNCNNSVYKSKVFRDKISNIVKGENNPNYNNKWTDEQKKRLGHMQRANPLYKDENNPNAKQIMCIETGKIYDCIKFALKEYRIKDEASISICLKERHRTAGKKHWVEINDLNKAWFLDDDNRFSYLLEVLKECINYKPIICLENKEIYYTMTDLAKHLNISVGKIKWGLEKNNNIFEYKNKKYVFVKNYKSPIPVMV